MIILTLCGAALIQEMIRIPSVMAAGFQGWISSNWHHVTCGHEGALKGHSSDSKINQSPQSPEAPLAQDRRRNLWADPQAHKIFTTEKQLCDRIKSN